MQKSGRGLVAILAARATGRAINEEQSKVTRGRETGSAVAMIIPIRCFTCGKVIGNKWESYLGYLQAEYTEG